MQAPPPKYHHPVGADGKAWTWTQRWLVKWTASRLPEAQICLQRVPTPRGLLSGAELPLHLLCEDFLLTPNFCFPGAKQQQQNCHQKPQLIWTFLKLYFPFSREPFPTQGLNQCLLRFLHCRQILYCWATGKAQVSSHRIGILRYRTIDRNQIILKKYVGFFFFLLLFLWLY